MSSLGATSAFNENAAVEKEEVFMVVVDAGGGAFSDSSSSKNSSECNILRASRCFVF